MDSKGADHSKAEGEREQLEKDLAAAKETIGQRDTTIAERDKELKEKSETLDTTTKKLEEMTAKHEALEATQGETAGKLEKTEEQLKAMTDRFQQAEQVCIERHSRV